MHFSSNERETNLKYFGPGEPGSSIASYGRRGVESTRAGVAEGTVGVGAFPPLSREALRNARVAMVTGHVPRGRGRGVRGGERTCAGEAAQRKESILQRRDGVQITCGSHLECRRGW